VLILFCFFQANFPSKFPKGAGSAKGAGGSGVSPKGSGVSKGSGRKRGQVFHRDKFVTMKDLTPLAVTEYKRYFLFFTEISEPVPSKDTFYSDNNVFPVFFNGFQKQVRSETGPG